MAGDADRGEGRPEVDEPGSELGRVAPDAPELEAAIVALRAELATAGHDACPATIARHLGRRFAAAPSGVTVRRILRRNELITP